MLSPDERQGALNTGIYGDVIKEVDWTSSNTSLDRKGVVIPSVTVGI